MFEQGALPDLIMLVCNYVPLWGEPRDASYADPVVDRLVTYIFKVTPVPFRKRSLAKFISADVLVYPTIHNIMTRLIFATLLGAYDYIDAEPPSFVTRRRLYERFAFRTMTPVELSRWILANEYAVRFIWMEYVIMFAIAAVPPLERIFRERYNWEVIVRGVASSCAHIRASYEAAAHGCARTWLRDVSRIRLDRQNNIDPLATLLRDAIVRELYRAYPSASLWTLSSSPTTTVAKFKRAYRATATTTTVDRTVHALICALNAENIPRRLAALFRSDGGGGASSERWLAHVAAGHGALYDAIDDEAPIVTASRWLALLADATEHFVETDAEIAGAAADAAAESVSATRRRLHDVVVRGVAAAFYAPLAGVEDHLDVTHKSLLDVSFRPPEKSFVQSALNVCNQLDDRFYVDARFRDAPATFPPSAETLLRETIFKFNNAEPLGFDWLVQFGVSLLTIEHVRAAQRLFCSETLRAQVGTTLEATLLTCYHDYYVFKRFFFWRHQHMSVLTYDVSAEMTQHQLARCLEFRRCRRVADLEPTLCSYYFCTGCQSFKGLVTGHASDLFPVMNGSRRKRVKKNAATAAATAAAENAASTGANVYNANTIMTALFGGCITTETTDDNVDGDDDDDDDDDSDSAASESEPDGARDDRSAEIRAHLRRDAAIRENMAAADMTADDIDRLAAQHSHMHSVSSMLETPNADVAAAAAVAAANERRRDEQRTAKRKRDREKLQRYTDVSNRVIDARHRSAIGNDDTFYNPSDDRIYCNAINFDTAQLVSAYRAEADQQLQLYAESYDTTPREAARWITQLKPEQRVEAQQRGLARRAAKASATDDGDDDDDVEVEASTDESSPSQTHVSGQRRSIVSGPKRRAATPTAARSLAPLLLGPASTATAAPHLLSVEPRVLKQIDPQNFKRLAKRERRVQQMARCGFEPLPAVNLIGRVFAFYGKLYFKCPTCIMPSIATVHFSKFASLGQSTLTCTFCNRDSDMLKLNLGNVVEAARRLDAEIPPKRRFHCVICEQSRVFTWKRVRQALVLDDDNAAAPEMRLHQFCRKHYRAIYTSAGTILPLSQIRRALAEDWWTTRDPKTGVRNWRKHA